MLQQKKIFCIIPAYNEEGSIVEVINKVKPLVDEIIVVDDCSTDQTFRLSMGQGITVLKHIINRGQGAALETGNKYAIRHGADIIVHFDADGQFLAEEIKDMAGPVLSGEADIVFGSRFLEKKSYMPFLKKNIIMPLARMVNKIFFSVSLTDPQCGFRALSENAAAIIKIEQDRMAHNSEIIAKAFKNNLRVKEVPVTVIYNDFGQKFSGGIKIIKELIIGAMVK